MHPEQKSPVRVLWSGRFSRQKNMDLLRLVIEEAADFHFDVYGSDGGPYLAQLQALRERVGNLTLKGVFPSAAALPTERYGVFLFTSLWEGLPMTLIDMAARGIPIVAPRVGGIPELVDDHTGWLVADPADFAGYVAALRDVRDNPQEAAERVERMARRVNERHSWENYVAALTSSPSFLN
jgi:glycosyltransferase involved in cell wall biosynthesis